MLLSKKLLAQIERKHNIKLTDKQAAIMDIMYGRYIKPDWNMFDFERGLRIALSLYPSKHQFINPDSAPVYEQLALEPDDPSLF